MRSWIRVIPTVAVLSLVVLVARAQTSRSGGGGPTSQSCAPVPPGQPSIQLPTTGRITAIQRNISCPTGTAATYFVFTGNGAVESLESTFGLTGSDGAAMPYPLAREAAGVSTPWPDPYLQITHTLDRPLVRWAVDGSGDDIVDAPLAFSVLYPAFTPSPPTYQPEWSEPGLPLLLAADGFVIQAPGNAPRLSGEWITSAPPVTWTAEWIGYQSIHPSQPLPLAGFDRVLQTFGTPVTTTAGRLEFAVDHVSGGHVSLTAYVGEVDATFIPGIGALAITATAAIELRAQHVPAFVATEPLSVTTTAGAMRMLPGHHYAAEVVTDQLAALAFDPTPSSTGGQLWLHRSDGSGWVQIPGSLGMRVVGVPERLSPESVVFPGRGIAEVVTPSAMLQLAARRYEQLLPVVDDLDEFSLPLARSAPFEPGGGATTTANLSLRLVDGSISPTATATPYRLYDAYAEPTATEIPFGRITRRTVTTDRPIVVDVLPGLASRPDISTSTALHVESDLSAPPLWPTYQPDGMSALSGCCVSMTAFDAFGSAMEIPGGNPLLAVSLGHALPSDPTVHRVCDMRIPQDLATVPMSVTYTAIQRFSVPSSCEAQWVEIALPPGQDPGTPLHVSIIDLSGHPLAGPVPSGPVADVNFADAQGLTPRAPIWRASSVLPPGQLLEQGHEYGLRIDVSEAWLLGSVITQTAQLFAADPGPGGGPWATIPGAIGFRLIGREMPAPGDVAPTPAVARLQVRLAPNPMRGALDVVWSGDGRAEVHVVDVGGRRVRWHVTSAVDAGGRWTWDGRDAAGHAVPAGVYFVRVLRRGGESAVERVVLMR